MQIYLILDVYYDDLSFESDDTIFLKLQIQVFAEERRNTIVTTNYKNINEGFLFEVCCTLLSAANVCFQSDSHS